MSSLYLLPESGGPEVTALGSTYLTKTDGTEVAGAYALLEEQFWAETTPLHRHVDAEESFYVLAGEVEVWVDGVTTLASSGDFLVVPRGVTHGLRRVSEEPVRMLTLVSPPGFEKVFEAVVEQGEESLLAEPHRLRELAARYGTEVLGDYPEP